MIHPALSILLPHLRTPANDAALNVALDCIVANTGVDYELIIQADAERSDVYTICNDMAARAAAEWIVFSNSDVFFAPGWAPPLLALAATNTIVAGTLVECGAIGVNERNIHKDFGMRPETFQRAAFEDYVSEKPTPPDGFGWFFPSLHHRNTFLSYGGFDTLRGGFPTPLDSLYWDRWLAMGHKVVRAPGSYAYHLQNWSNAEEQTKAVRHQ